MPLRSVCRPCLRLIAALVLHHDKTHTMAGVEAVVAALNVFAGAADKLAIDNANAWLQDFQHSVNTPFRSLVPRADEDLSDHRASPLLP